MDIDWSVFDRRASDEPVRAARLVQALLTAAPPRTGDEHGAWQRALAGCSDRVLWHAFGRARMLRLHEPAGSAAAARLDALCDAIAAAYSDPATLPGSPVPNGDKLSRHVALWDDYAAFVNDAGNASLADLQASYAALDARIQATMALEPADYLHGDLHHMRAMLADAMATSLARHLRFDDATALYAKAAGWLEQVGLQHDASTCEMKIVNLQYNRATDIRAALQALLTLKDDERLDPGPATGVIVERMLAETYAKIGDAYEALRQVERVTGALAALGFAAPGEQLDGTLVESWIREADRSTDTLMAFTERLNLVLQTFMSCANVVGKASPDAAACERAFAAVEALEQWYALQTERYGLIERTDREYVRTLDPPLSGDGGDAALVSPQYERYDPGALEDCRHREQQGECGEDLQRDLAVAIAAALARGDGRTADALRNTLGRVRLTLEQYAEAAELFREAARGAAARGDVADYPEYLCNWATSLACAGDHAGASDVCDEGIAAIEAKRDSLGPPSQQSAFIAHNAMVYAMGVATALRLEDDDLLLQRIELVKCAASLRDIANAIAPLPDEASSALLERIRHVEDELASGQAHDPAAALDRRRRLYDLWELRRRRGQALPPPSRDRIQAALAEDEAVLHYFWMMPTVLLVVALDRRDMIVRKQVLGEDEVAHLQALVDELDDMRHLHIDERRLARFRPLLVPDDVRPVLDGKRRLRISPHGLLHVFPFHLLRLDDRYLLQRHAVSYLPNLSALLLPLTRPGGEATFALGVSRFNVPGTPLSDLPAVATEIDALAARYRDDQTQAEIWRDGEAGVARLRDRLRRGGSAGDRIWHIATHGEDVLDNAAYPMETRLFLSDGTVDALEIGSWQLHAELVVLSVCHSGRRAYRDRLGESALGGDEMFGLPAAFFKAGTHALLGALWPAHDATACAIMSSLHRHLRDLPPDLALQAAMLDYLGGLSERGPASARAGSRDVEPVESADDATNPARWAPFFLTRLGPLAR